MKMKLQLRKGKEKSKNLCQEKFKKKSAVLYPEPESNRHDRNGHRILSPACLPVPPPGHRHCKNWSGRRDSNPRPRPWQGRALPTELLPHLCFRHELFQKRRKDKNSPINYTSFQGLKFLFFFHY